MYPTKTIDMQGTDAEGNPVTIPVTVPLSIPTEERSETLRSLYREHVKHPDGHWKGRAAALVPAAIAEDVAEAMDFMGSIVDVRKPMPGGRVMLFSEGYWAHGF